MLILFIIYLKRGVVKILTSVVGKKLPVVSRHNLPQNYLSFVAIRIPPRAAKPPLAAPDDLAVGRPLRGLFSAKLAYPPHVVRSLFRCFFVSACCPVLSTSRHGRPSRHLRPRTTLRSGGPYGAFLLLSWPIPRMW